MRRLDISGDAEKFVDHLDAKQYRQVVRKIFSLANNPTPQDSIKIQGKDYRRADQGEFRIVYYFDEDNIYIVEVGKRNDDEVYKKAQRK
jgi:mRNA interferase RelE/StbE